MLQVTDEALGHLSEMLDQADAPEGSAIRFVVTQEGIQLALSETDGAAATFDHGGKTVLVLDEQVSDMLSNHVLETEQTDEGTGLKLNEQAA